MNDRDVAFHPRQLWTSPEGSKVVVPTVLHSFTHTAVLLSRFRSSAPFAKQDTEPLSKRKGRVGTGFGNEITVALVVTLPLTVAFHLTT